MDKWLGTKEALNPVQSGMLFCRENRSTLNHAVAKIGHGIHMDIVRSWLYTQYLPGLVYMYLLHNLKNGVADAYLDAWVHFTRTVHSETAQF